MKKVLEPGDVVGGLYRIERVLASGGMGTVYLARHQTLGRDMALKTLKAERVDGKSWKHIMNEARVLSRLDHPVLVKVYDIGKLDELPYYVMDYIVGETLAARIKKSGAQPLDLALRIFEQIANGMAYAEEHKLVHRDIKPGNIILQASAGSANTDSGITVKLLDFGLVSTTGGATTTDVASNISGSPPYMSPEQSLYQDVDSRSDIYSTGCALFETLTGVPPFVGESALITLSKHQTETPPTLKEASLGTEYPQALEKLLAKMLAKNPDNRIQTFADLEKILEKIRLRLDAEPQETAPAARYRQAQDASESESKVASPRDPKAAVEAKAKSPRKKLLYLAVIAIACAVACIALFLPIKIIGGVDGKKSPVNIVSDPQRVIADFYASNHLVETNATGYILHFPDELSLGLIKTASGEGREARGKFSFARGEKLYFKPQSYLLDVRYARSYNILGEFPRDCLYSLDLSDQSLSDNGYLAQNAAALGALETLDLSNTACGDSIIKVLNGFPALENLTITRTDLTGDGLLRLTRLQNLKSLSIGKIFQYDRLLESLSKSRSLSLLSVEGGETGREELTLISSIISLDNLSLRDTGSATTGRDELAILARAPLTSLTLADMDLGDEACSALARLKNLRSLKLVRMRASSETLEGLKRDLPAAVISIQN